MKRILNTHCLVSRELNLIDTFCWCWPPTTRPTVCWRQRNYLAAAHESTCRM